MTERVFQLDITNPVDIYGVNDRNLELIRERFPKLKIIGRGQEIKAIGETTELLTLSTIIESMLLYCHKNGKIDMDETRALLGMSSEIKSDKVSNSELFQSGDILLYGNNGLIIKVRTENQRKMVESLQEKDMLFAIGPAGTGKTYTAVALAVRALKNKEIRRIILTRPAVEAGENLGFLPGDLREKLDPYLQPLYDALREMIPPDKLTSHIENGVIQIAPLAFMRGRTLDNAFVILDEAQNATQSQMKMFLTRMGRNARFIVTGDTTQVDLPRHQPSGLIQAIQLLKNVPDIAFVYLNEKDVIRHKLVKNIIEAYQKYDEKKRLEKGGENSNPNSHRN